jgi:Glycosyltransferase 61
LALIDRKGSRAIRNKQSIQNAIISIFPAGQYEMTFMEDLSPLEQWQFWASKDILLAAHGQAEANAIFLHPNASIIEMYPPHYYPQYFNGLFHSIGIHHFPFFNDVQNWHEDHISHSTMIVDHAFYRGVKYINPNINSIMILFQQALLKTFFTIYVPLTNILKGQIFYMTIVIFI